MSLEEAVARNPHLGRYLREYTSRTGRAPEYHESLSRDLKDAPRVNFLYPVGDPIFIHVYEAEEEGVIYHAIEPRLESPEDEKKYTTVLEKILEIAPYADISFENGNSLENIKKLYDTVVSVGTGKKLFSNRIELTKEEYDKYLYLIERDIIGTGPIEPMIRDPYIEDIHVIGPNNTSLVHKIFGTAYTNITFGDDIKLAEYLKRMGERIGRPVSEASPIVDGSLPDGSRINIIYSTDVSRKGSSFTIRKFTSTPLSITQLVAWNTLSSTEAAYLWLCLEYGMSVFVCGETASGKTTTLNASLPFIKHTSKIYSAEDTAEVLPPHRIWQQLITRDRGPEEGRVTLFDLLKAALRSRPNYIIVGEIRGEEGAVAFQAMQTGHPVISTFHAASVRKMIQRFTGHPINVPITFIDNLNVVLIQQAVYRKGKFLRRVTSIEEIEGYYEELKGVATRRVFEWDPVNDTHVFRGLNNSYVLETKIAETAGYEDPREIYDELFLRARIIEKMIEKEIFSYHEVVKVIKAFYQKGLEGLPFRI